MSAGCVRKRTARDDNRRRILAEGNFPVTKRGVGEDSADLICFRSFVPDIRAVQMSGLVELILLDKRMLSLASSNKVVYRDSGRFKVCCPNGSGDSGCYESRHLPGRLKVAPYEVRGRVAKNRHSPEGTAEFSLGSHVGKSSFVS